MTSAPGKRILIVDDDPSTVALLEAVLKKAGYSTASAGDAAEGLAKARSERPALVLLDVMMRTGTEGFHVVWELRRDSQPEVRDVPIIMLTGIHATTEMRFYPDQSDGTYGPHEYLPVQAFLDKPVDPDKLLAEVRLALKEGQSNPG